MRFSAEQSFFKREVVMSENDGHSFSIIKAFLAGTIVGAGLALLFAPYSGEETRRKLAEKKDDASKAIKDTAEKMVDRGREMLDEGKKSLDSLKSDMNKLVDEGKKSISHIREEISGLVEEGKTNLKKTIKDEMASLEEELSDKKTRRAKS